MPKTYTTEELRKDLKEHIRNEAKILKKELREQRAMLKDIAYA